MAFINGKEVFLVQTGSGGGGSGALDALIEGSLTELTSNATAVRDRICYQYLTLTSVKFPNATAIGQYAFYGCSALTTVDFPSATTISTYAFQNCTELTNASFPNVTHTYSSAFSTCSKLKSVSLPNSTNVYGGAFTSCRSLTKVIIGTSKTFSVAKLASADAFSYCCHILGTTDATYNPTGAKDGYIYVPDNLVNAYKGATNWSTYADQIKGISELPTEE